MRMARNDILLMSLILSLMWAIFVQFNDFSMILMTTSTKNSQYFLHDKQLQMLWVFFYTRHY